LIANKPLTLLTVLVRTDQSATLSTSWVVYGGRDSTSDNVAVIAFRHANHRLVVNIRRPSGAALSPQPTPIALCCL